MFSPLKIFLHPSQPIDNCALKSQLQTFTKVFFFLFLSLRKEFVLISCIVAKSYYLLLIIFLNDCKLIKLCSIVYPALLKYNLAKQVSPKLILYKSIDHIIPSHIILWTCFNCDFGYKMEDWLQCSRPHMCKEGWHFISILSQVKGLHNF